MTKDEQIKAIEEDKGKIKKTKRVKEIKTESPEKKEIEEKEQKVEESNSVNEKKEEQIEPKKKETIKIKKNEAIVNAYNIPISTKEASYICKFIKRKKISNAISDLERVLKMKKAVPMKGEIPHRKGNIMSGRYPQKAAKNFIVLLKSLLGNTNLNEIDEPIIIEAVANIGRRPYGKFGKYRRKRTNIFIRAIEKKKILEVKK